ncbi:hypothetical protein [Sphingosinicella microcystinivorans]|uniref:hypothetical protein n=1 Tax=Sphingosinicella microcystinivorans TaxID=335406 RepID=UPI0022F38036|nr:hypothetical protein [Sphingosinicella microcystinivorans]WBX84458.1 hypothetical protein PE061_00565 [Sphingosinicella microcystinivorans]
MSVLCQILALHHVATFVICLADEKDVRPQHVGNSGKFLIFIYNVWIWAFLFNGTVLSFSMKEYAVNRYFEPAFGHADVPLAPRTRVSEWLWRPWYAKLWWVAIPVWWMGMAASVKVAPLASFYDSAFAGYLNILFFPPTALVVLAVGYVRAWLDARPAGDGSLSWDEIKELERIRIEEEYWERGPGGVDPSFDIYDPRSGALYVGNPFGPNSVRRQHQWHRFEVVK